MSCRDITILLTAAILLLTGTGFSQSVAQSSVPSYADSPSFSSVEFQRILSQLKTERDALDAEWNALTKRLHTPTTNAAPDFDRLHDQLKQTLKRLQQERTKANQPEPMPPETPKPPITKKVDSDSQVDPRPESARPTAEVDLLHLAQTLFRAERYDEALAVFRKVDLKGKKAEERGPIVFLTASCLHRLGRTEEAVALLRDVANSRGDERFASYAQWELESMRWQRDVRTRLDDLRQRREALEKR